jgi:hypothetical protein
MSQQMPLDKSRAMMFVTNTPATKVDRKTLLWIHNEEYKQLVEQLPSELRHIGFKLRAIGKRQAHEMGLSKH